MIKKINTKDLMLDDLPSENADWHQISLFALSFDWIAESPVSRFDSVLEHLDENMPTKEVRAYLYFQQRWWNNRTGKIDEDGLNRVYKAIELIRSQLISEEKR